MSTQSPLGRCFPVLEDKPKKLKITQWRDQYLVSLLQDCKFYKVIGMFSQPHGALLFRQAMKKFLKKYSKAKKLYGK